MTILNRIKSVVPVLVFLAGCDKNFESINTNPYAFTNINPAQLFTNAQRLTHAGFWEGEQTIVQQFVNAYNTGATAGFNFNEDNNNFNVPRWNDNYPGPVKLLEQITSLVAKDDARPNLYSMTRIWKSYIFMTLADTYGDIPYNDAGKAYLQNVFYPGYDKDELVYEELYKEIKAATEALNPAGEMVKEDLFFGNAASVAVQVAQWKKLGYTLLFRLGMRYSKLDQTKARSIVREAYAGGLIQTNNDNVFIVYNAIYNNPLNAGPRGTNPYFYYLAEPFINKLKSTGDPRLKYISGKYADPNQVLALTPDTTMANQFGFPVGYDQTSVLNYPGYRGTNGTGQNYSQLNFLVLGSATAPVFYITNAQTRLLLAEAAHRGWLTGLPGVLTAQQYYEEGVKASMDDYNRYPNTPSPAIPASQQNNYLAQAGVAFVTSNALELINTQYWIASIANGAESFANFRRSGYPVLNPNKYNNNLQGGFVRRFAWPNEESARNSAHYQEAVSSMGADNLTTRVFWDVP
ncbi:SusD/RagB family nutrient-binding outer membrane lipoprotein [Niastella caeni]|uniref:SusD/RagB family nutrient-binding outer membrane lipoprotein n=1 Tax=Niastella caeni TaxID=2569763 RepID=A0A4S8HWQ3_9BACT|nr:SusD/RagB family nutrient-binding outer membrane lipoprotein [Niastella caeni]THU40158.1 SusD/RagB family nutrient-binding outer membrane lipoprotein [Niastella caeni]